MQLRSVRSWTNVDKDDAPSPNALLNLIIYNVPLNKPYITTQQNTQAVERIRMRDRPKSLSFAQLTNYLFQQQTTVYQIISNDLCMKKVSIG